MCFPVIGGLTSNITVIGDYDVRTTLLSKVGLRVEGSGHEMIDALNFLSSFSCTKKVYCCITILCYHDGHHEHA